MFQEFSHSPELPVLIIGAAGTDIVGRLRSEISWNTSIPAEIRTSFGGVARNVAENLARLGQPVKLLTVVGEDKNGDRLLDHASEAGIDVSAVLRSANGPTGTYIAVVNPRGELCFGMDDMRVINALTPEYIEQHYALFKEASILFMDMNLPKNSLRKAMSMARKANLPVCVDPTSKELSRKVIPYLSRFRMITPNSSEAGLLCDHDFDISDREEALFVAKHLVSQGVEIVIISLAEFGVCYATSETSGNIPAIRTDITDPTGTGDALTATVLFALLNDIPLDDAVRLGVSAATLTLRYRGAVVPDLTIEKLYDQLVI
jgi:pseudouridine kinase